MPDTDPGSLERLHDIATAPPVSWWPLAPGWYIVAAVGAILLGIGISVAIVRWRRDGYRREALRELEPLIPSKNLAAIAELLKRVALAAYPREQVASLTGGPWLAFLDATGGNGRFASGSGQVLEAALFRPGPLSVKDDDFAALVNNVCHWIKHHRC